MKTLTFFMVLLLNFSPSTQVVGKHFSGYIFNKDHFVMVDAGQDFKRYTPTKEDVYKSEEIIKTHIKLTNRNLINQAEPNPIIHQNLNKYVRQYVGFINSNNEKIIWVNFIWKQSSQKHHLEKDLITVLDGGSYYWNVMVDIKNNNLYDLDVNGDA